MTPAAPPSGQALADISILYELALASGRSLELEDNCSRFTKALMARKNLAFASVWVHTSQISGHGREGFDLIYAHPRFRVREDHLPGSHPLVRLLAERGSFSVSHGDPQFEAAVCEKRVEGGALAVFPLRQSGFLKLYSVGQEALFDKVGLNQLEGVIDKFAVSVEGCVAHQQVVQEISERERVEGELRQLNQNLEHLVEERTAEIRQTLEQLKQAQAQLLQSEKMASIGQLAAGVAHEINNPVGFVSSNLGTLAEYAQGLRQLLEAYGQLESRLSDSDQEGIAAAREAIAGLKDDLGLDFVLEDLDSLVAESREGTQRVRKIVQNLKEFAHVDREEKSLANLNDGLESTLNIVWNELKYKAEVEKSYGELPEIECYPQELNQVFTNILVNASQAIEERGTITIRSFVEDACVCVAIADTGKGMSAEVRERIFEPFFTTKEVGKGTGLGLSMAYNIVHKHDGDIRIDSQEGVGTTFTIAIPIHPDAAPPGTARATPAPEEA